MLIDTKYKELKLNDNTPGLSRDDVYQILAYASRTKADAVMLLYPGSEAGGISGTYRTKFSFLTDGNSTNHKTDLYIGTMNFRHDLTREWNPFIAKFRRLVSSTLLRTAPA